MKVNFTPYFTMSISLSETAVTFCSPFLANFTTYKFKKSLNILTINDMYLDVLSHSLKFQYFQILGKVKTSK